MDKDVQLQDLELLMVTAKVILDILVTAMHLMVTKPTLLLTQEMMSPCPMTRMVPEK